MPMSDFVTWYGRDEAPPERTRLRAGPLTAVLEGGDLRSIRLGSAELARRIYVAVRDVNWGTIAGVISGLRIQHDEDSFRVTYGCTHRRGAIAFDWTATFEGAADGTITCAMDGVARGEFRYYRIGFCVLHPIGPGAGAPFRAWSATGSTAGTLPTLIEPPRIEDGVYLPLIPAYTTFELEQGNGADVRFAFEGDLFEMEDERSWTDASFKTYCTPFAAGILSASPGQGFHQKVTMSARARTHAAQAVAGPSRIAGARDATPEPVTLTLGLDSGRTLPKLGLGCAGDGRELSDREMEELRVLRLSHLRVDLRLWETSHLDALERAVREARALGCGLELALFVTDDGERELSALAPRLAGVPVARVLVFHEPQAHLETTDARWVHLARERLGVALGGAPVGGGTNGNLAELVGSPLDASAMDVVSYTANPQMHASDESSILENLEALDATVRTARSVAGGRDIAVSRITMKPPFGTYDIEPAPPPGPGDLPSHVDPRQMSLFGACWIMGSLKQLAESGVASVTIGETVGWAGLVEREAGNPAPDLFLSQPGMAFPMYHVLADLATAREGAIVACASSEPRSAIGLALRTERGLAILVANMGPQRRRVTIGPLPAGRALVRVLDARSAPEAMFRPREFRASWSPVESEEGQVALELEPYATAALRVEAV